MTPERIMSEGQEGPPPKPPKDAGQIIPPEPDWMPGVVPESPRERQRRSSRPSQYGRKAQPPRRGAPRGEAGKQSSRESSNKKEAGVTPVSAENVSTPAIPKPEIGETQEQYRKRVGFSANAEVISAPSAPLGSPETPPEITPPPVSEEKKEPEPPAAAAGGGEGGDTPPPPAPPGGGSNGEPPDDGNGENPEESGDSQEEPSDVNAQESQPRMGRAIWVNQHQNIEVNVVEHLGKGVDGREYVKIEGSDTGIPLDEISWPDPAAETEGEEPEAAPFKGELSDEEFDIKKIAAEAGIPSPLVETEDWELLQKIVENVQIIGGSTDIDEIIAAAKELNLPAGRLKSMLMRRGRGKDLLDALDARREELPLREPEPEDETPEEREEIGRAEAETALAEALVDEAQEVVNQMDSSVISKEDAKRELGRLGKLREKMHERIFNEEYGLLRQDRRWGRLVGRPLGAGAFAALIFWLTLTHWATNWATKRVGK